MTNLPERILNHLSGVSGFDRHSFNEAHLFSEPAYSIRINPDKVDNASQLSFSDLFAGDVPWCEYGKYLSERPSYISDPLWHAGAYYVQEASSMFLRQVLKELELEDSSDTKILDFCASPGGKSTLIATAFRNALLVCNEAIKSRVNTLIENCTKWGSENIVITSNDARDYRKLSEYFDLIVADVPCSGSGLFRKQPEAIEEWSENNVMLCCERQERILTDLLPALKPGGYLVYSTCSYSVEEDENIVNWLLESFPLHSVRIELAGNENIVETGSEKIGWSYRFFPDKVKGEGFFIALLKKDGERTNKKIKTTKYSRLISPVLKLTEWLKKDTPLFFIQHQNKTLIIPECIKNELIVLQEHLYLKKAGIEAGTEKGDDLIPDHSLALSRVISTEIPAIELSQNEALDYLRKNELSLSSGTKGWVLMRYQGINLGWAKLLGNRINNYYPTSWRILKY